MDANDSKYAFDSQEITKLPKDQYPSVKNADGTAVLVPYKAVVNGKDDLITAKITITDQEILKDAKIEFKVLSSGKNIEAVQSGNDYKLKLKGAYDYAEEEIVAALVPNDKEKKQQIISSFRLVHLSPKDINVSFVPLDKEAQNKLDDYGNKVNSTYQKVGINFNVRKEDIPKGFSELGIGDKIESGDPKLMSTYGSDQIKINSLYKGTDQRYVMFVTSKQASTGADGYFRLTDNLVMCSERQKIKLLHTNLDTAYSNWNTLGKNTAPYRATQTS
ncbi:hypothetical protein BPO_p0039 (plasmid) [Bergeyella porcorum]|uniref:Uncharacterized protein n=1 Tax=Bergeyella porcorum TaxID=1735111 RepID=A0AAU0F3Z4_9FLAO